MSASDIVTEYVVIHHNPEGHSCAVYSEEFKDDAINDFVGAPCIKTRRTELWECIWDDDGQLEWATLINRKGKNSVRCSYSLPMLRHYDCLVPEVLRG